MNKATRKSIQSTYNEVISLDSYKLNDWPNNFFDTIIDIGANIGIFVMYAHMRNPHSNILAYEPCKSTYEELTRNVWFLNNVKCFNQALGDGSPLFFYDTGYSESNLFYKENDIKPTTQSATDSYSIESCTLLDIFTRNKIGEKYLIKMDCEGGERFLLNDDKCIEIIKKSHASCLEIHFPPTSETAPSYERFKEFPVWQTWNTWIHTNFAATHSILYHHSNKRRGHGIYVLKLNVPNPIRT